MANVNPFGVTGSDGKENPLRPGDVLRNSTLTTLFTTGMVGVTGILGATGIANTTVGVTGIQIQGRTGILGITGIAIEGETGLGGLTGFRGFTGISVQGSTGIKGETGITGFPGLVGAQGKTGVAGYTGLAGNTGLFGSTGLTGATGLAVNGATGLQGNTGILGPTGLQGETGVGLLGITGLRGTTGMVGTTGLLDLITLTTQRQTSGATLLYTIPANSFGRVGQQLELTAWGLSATDGSATTVTITYAGNQVFQDNIALAGGSDIMLEGYILLWGAISHDVSIKSVYENGNGVSSYIENVLVSSNISQDLYVTLESLGTGHTLYGLIVRRQAPGFNNLI